jgi:leucyl-tRNA synthetase
MPPPDQPILLHGVSRGRARSASRRKLEPDLLIEDTITLPVQINGKKRGDVTVARNAQATEIESAVLALDAVKRHWMASRRRK